MSEKREEHLGRNVVPKVDLPEGEEIVISGIAGRFPESRNVLELQKNLLNKKDLITDDDRRWFLDHPEIPNRTGKIDDLSKFDAPFFGVHFKQAHAMDPMCRMLLEHAYEALIDAGVNPKDLRGRRTAVLIGACYSESEKTWFYEKVQINGFGITGCSKAMLANRISYWLGVHGPSFMLDTACSSSLYALENAYRLIHSGQCEDALVGGCNLCLHPFMSLQFARLGVLSADGTCKCFDATADGYARSETVSLVYLQKQKNAKRIYATVVHAKTNCDGYKEQGITFPSSDLQLRLLEDFYEECRIPPESLAYMEAHGTGTRVGDPEEVGAIAKVLCRNRKEPLLIGSVKSNLGHSEPASAMCSIAKVVIAMETGIIPPNIHYNTPRKGIKAIQDGTVKVVAEPTPWKGGYIGVSSFGFGGANAHVLLKSNPKEKINNGLPSDDLPRLVTVSGRTEEAVNELLNSVEKSLDVEYMRLLHDVHAESINNHVYRGYTIVYPKKPSEHPIREVQNSTDAKKPIWFIFSGMGSQWAGMGEPFMKFPVFARAIKKCDAVLKPRGIDIVNVITNKDKKLFDNILNSFIGIAAVQIGLVDLLKSVGIEPDNIIGHSVGELGCAYADGCFTAEQMILSAYSRGLASLETKMIRGSMAAVALGYQNIKNICPPDIEVACHNAAESCTISGPAESLQKFVAQLQAKDIFAKEVPCCNIAYHSRYIAGAGSKLLAYLKEVIPEPKARSRKWLSTSVPHTEWSTHQAQFSSAEYHTNNLLNPVLFEETAAFIPSNAIAIEIAPHGLLQAILKRSLHKNVVNIPLTQRGHKDNTEFFLQALGKLYNVGVQPKIANLYPPIEFPVSRGTPMIAPHIRWEHSTDWFVTSFKQREKMESGERQVSIKIDDEGCDYIVGHVINERNLLPGTEYINLLWDTYAMMLGKMQTEVSIVMENIKFLRATNMPKEGAVKLLIMIHKGSGMFEISEAGVAVVTGTIRTLTNPAVDKISPEFIPKIDDEELLTTKDIYKELRLRGYQYSGLFRGVKSLSLNANKGHIAWVKNWVTFMDNMLQLSILKLRNRSLYVPTSIRKLVIDVKSHYQQIQNLPDDKQELPVYQCDELNAIISGGIEIHGTGASTISKRKPTSVPVLEEYKFVAHRDKEEVSLETMLTLSSHIVLENHLVTKVKSIEMVEKEDDVLEEDLLIPKLRHILSELPLVTTTLTVVAPANSYNSENLSGVTITELGTVHLDGSSHIAMGYNLFTKKKEETLKSLICSLTTNGYILTREKIMNDETEPYFRKHGLFIILEKRYKAETLLLLKVQEIIKPVIHVLHVNSWEFSWLEKLQNILRAEMEENKNEPTKLILVAEGDPESGLLGMSNCLRKEPKGDIIRSVIIQNPNAPKFSLNNPFYANQIELDLAVNVLGLDNVWGSYRHLPLPPPQPKLVNHAYVDQLVPGQLNTLTWLQGPYDPDSDDENLIKTAYVALNFKDIMLASGRLSGSLFVGEKPNTDSILGFEYSGINKKGQRVMGLASCMVLSNLCKAEPTLTWIIPDEWSLEDAATIPVVYSTAAHALFYYGKMKKGDKVLIHAGTGGVGQAAIHLALHEGCEIFTTVGTAEKRQFIKDFFPSINDDHIGNSRDTSFEQLIMKQTNGRGVDIVLNSLSEEKLQASVRCLAYGGRFLEIGKFDLAANNALGMRIFLKEISFHGIMLDNMMIGSLEDKLMLQHALRKAVDSGAVKPLVRTIFNRDQIETAFRYMTTGKHVGKVLIKVHNENAPFNEPILAHPRYCCAADKSYVIFGGLGGLGLEVADWLFQRYARNLVLVSRGGIKDGYQRLRIETWKHYGANVIVISGMDASKDEDCIHILKTAEKLAPVDGIFNLAVVLRDSICVNQTVETFEESIKPKAWITKKLDEHSRKLCPKLRQFVVFSSVSCGRGTAGQTNYGMANSVMERICERRVREGLPGLAIEWGAIGDVGLVANMNEDNKELVISGTLQQKVSSCLEELDKFLVQSRPIVSSMVVAEKRAGDSNTDIVGCVLNIMGLKDLKSLSKTVSLAELGMDSMMGVEIKQTLERDFEVFLSPQDIRTLTFGKLIEMSEKDTKQIEKKVIESNETLELTGITMFLQSPTMKMNLEPYIEFSGKNPESPRETFIIPGLEGAAAVFDNMASKIIYPITCIQLPFNTDQSITSLAKALLPYIVNKIEESGKEFVVIGYSFGTLVTIEIARLLEAKGFVGSLILIDGSPTYMKESLAQHVPSETEDQLQCNVLVSIMDVVYPSKSPELSTRLTACKTFEERVDALLHLVPSNVLSSEIDEQKKMCTTIYKRLTAVKQYDCSSVPPLKLPITLLKPAQPAVRLEEDDYGLSKVTSGKVTIFNLKGNHTTMLNDDNIIAAISGESIENETFKDIVNISSGLSELTHRRS